ncbi:MAG: glycosyltransferase family 4 protein [Elusimicrobiales bacterium]
MTKKKIWLITPFSPLPGEGWGGVKTHAEYLTVLLLWLGAELTVIVPEGVSRPGPSPAGFQVETVPCTAMPHTARWRAAMRATATRLLATGAPHLVFSEGYFAAGCERLLRSAGVPLAAFVHNFHLVHYRTTFSEVSGPGTLLRYLLKALPLITFKMLFVEIPFLRRADLVISVSEHNARRLLNFYRIPAARLTVLHNWVNTEIFRNSSGLRDSTRKKLGLPRDVVCFIGVGSLWRPKGFHIAIQAFKILAELEPKAVLLLAGEGGEENRLRTLAGPELTGSGRVKFLGKVQLSEIREAYNAADAFLMPSIHPEGLAYTLIEAMACGLPAIATSLGGNIETLRGCGILVKHSDPREMAAAMLRLASDPQKRGTMGQACLARANAEFSVPAAEQILKKIIEGLLPKKQI